MPIYVRLDAPAAPRRGGPHARLHRRIGSTDVAEHRALDRRLGDGDVVEQALVIASRPLGEEEKLWRAHALSANGGWACNLVWKCVGTWSSDGSGACSGMLAHSSLSSPIAKTSSWVLAREHLRV